ncbi:MAG: ribosome biogenesis GTPase YlqF [Oscillospiraceae bacterium]|jgi:ribosome biogenesis GTPase A|nr:ribosome biogenesis GTPase YlqF [Oscillospiraceae bacterium]
MNIQWFPGHMTKARRKIVEDIKLVDAVCEVVDARIPRSSANPDIGELTAPKPRLVILNRTDLADSAATKKWAGEFRRLGFGVLETDCKSGRGIDKFPAAARELCTELLARRADKGQSGKSLRLMVVGIPNVGKSSFINRVAGRKAANTSDRPGVTRGRQWINCDGGIELLDTPGILWPKFDDAQTGENLAITGAVKDDILDIELLGSRLLLRLWDAYPERVIERYKLKPDDAPDADFPLEIIAKRRGYLISGGEFDTRRAAIMLLDEYRGGKLGRLTLEFPE